jgi:hypothetical protein
MLTVQMMIGRVEGDLKKGSIQSKYQGYITGAHKRDAAIGQANASEDSGALGTAESAVSTLVLEFLPIHKAVTRPTSTANPTPICGAATLSNIANNGSLKRKFLTKVPSEPVGICP